MTKLIMKFSMEYSLQMLTFMKQTSISQDCAKNFDPLMGYFWYT